MKINLSMNNPIIKGTTSFYLAILVIIIVTITTWLSGYEIHRTILDNAVYSISILTLVFFLFLSISLYIGVGFEDDYPKKSEIQPQRGIGDVFSSADGSPRIDFPLGDFVSEGIEGIIIGILMWLGIMLLTILFMVFFEYIFLATLLAFMGSLYWIFFRATRMVFRYVRWTKNNFKRSAWVGFKYSLLYTGWICAILWISKMMKTV
jgi:hypothetical protein